MQTKQPNEERTTQCKPIITERNRYFTGKYMTKRDFEHEQAYLVSRHQLHNRLLHGMGIVCGLEVTKHPDPKCENRWVVVEPGIAIDCCGRELIFEKKEAYELPLPPEPPSAEEPGTAQKQPDADVMYEPFLLVLRYEEEEIEHVPAIYSDDGCGSDRQEANRVREKAVLGVLSLDEVDTGCWITPAGAPDPSWPTWLVPDCPTSPCTASPGQIDPETATPSPAGVCLKPRCPCRRTVPLALITFDPDCVENGFKIDISGRRHLPISEEFLTHIVHINWPHGGYLTLEDLRERDGRLEVHFDGEIELPAPERGEGFGVNEHTMKVQYQEHTERSQLLQDLPFSEQNRPKSESGSVAVFTIDPSYYASGGRNTDEIDDATIFVSLYCDFISDRSGNPVDGDHLKGQLPSGNGSPGGVFRSWFRIVDDATPAIALSIDGATTAKAGGKPVWLDLHVTNRSPIDLHNVTIVKNPGLQDEETIDGWCSKTLLSGGLSYSCKHPVSIPANATSPFKVIFQVSGESEDRARVYDTSQHVIQLVGAEPTLEVTKCRDKDAAGYPGVLTYDITIKNNATQSLTDVVLVDRYWARGGTVNFEDSEPENKVEVDEDGRRMTWRWSELPAGSEISIKTRMRLDLAEREAAAAVVNCARVSANTSNGMRIRDSAKAKTTVRQIDRDQA